MKDRMKIFFRNEAAHGLAFLVGWLGVRGYEWLSVSARVQNSSPELNGLLYDFAIGLPILFLVFATAGIVSAANVKLGRVVSLFLFTLALIFHFAVTQYFVVTLLPLSSDLFGYSVDDMLTTVSSSGSIGIGGSLFFITLLVVFFYLNYYFKHKPAIERVTAPLALLFSVSGFFLMVFPIQPSAEDFEHDVEYYQSVNKIDYLIKQTNRFLSEQKAETTFAKDEYPFLHKINYEDPIGRYMNSSKELPNIVFIVVEGLGRDFVGSDAPFKGFTPFLDSLTTKSLFWKNALSNAGRTFGAPPSILGSLPYGRSGIMNYGTALPDHQTIISLLKPYGYRSEFFYGGNPNFDNLDLFLERQGIDQFINESNFSDSVKINKATSAWGYTDRDVFTAATNAIKNESGPRLDIFLTLSTHEPFVCPDERIKMKADQRIESLPSSIKTEVMANKNIFECLLYTDNAIRELMKAYQRRADFANTIFIITGDHRLIPMPSENKIKRFHVPLIVYSPLIAKPHVFSSLAIHSAITPTLLGLLHDKSSLRFPDEMPFISEALVADSLLSSNLDLPLIRNKNSVTEYVEGNYFLSDDRLYTIEDNLTLNPLSNPEVKARLKKKLADFQRKSIFALDNNRLDKVQSGHKANAFVLTKEEEQYLVSEHTESMNPEQQFEKARTLAFAKEYGKSRSFIKQLLNNSPNFHDARILMARTYGWEKQYDSAEKYIKQVIHRAPAYADAYVALADVEYWRGASAKSLQASDSGLLVSGANPDLMIRKARSLSAMGKNHEAKLLVDVVIKNGSRDEIALDLEKRLKNE